MMNNLHAAQTNAQCNLIQEITLYEFGLGHNDPEATKDICRTKGVKYSWSQYSNQMI